MAKNEIQERMLNARRFLKRRVRWLTRTANLFIVGLIIAHPFVPELVHMITGLFGFAEPSLAALVALSVLLFVAERVVVIEQVVTDDAENRPVRVFATNEAAYERLTELIDGMKPRRVDLLQFSGWHTGALIRKLGQITPPPAVRLLLMDPGVADGFDTREFHRQRIVATDGSARRLKQEEKLAIDVRYYSSVPSLSAVLVDDAVVNLSWYCCHHEKAPDICRLLGHSCAAVMGTGPEAAPLLAFARSHFDHVWSTASEHAGHAGTPSELAHAT
jgi:hypothetical protein